MGTVRQSHDFGIQSLHLFFNGNEFTVHSLTGLFSNLSRHRAHSLGDFVKFLLNSALRFAQFFQLFSQLIEGLCRLCEGAKRCIQIHNSFANGHGQGVKLNDVLSHPSRDGKERTDRDQNEDQHGAKHDARVRDASLMGSVDTGHHLL